MIDAPVDDSLRTTSSSGISWITFSSLSVTSCSTRAGLAPGKNVATTAVRIVNPGSKSRGMPT